MDNNHIRIQKAAKILGVSAKTLRRWEEKGKLIPERSDGGHRYYTYEQLRQFNSLTANSANSNKQEALNTKPIRNFGFKNWKLFGTSILVLGILIPGIITIYSFKDPVLQDDTTQGGKPTNVLGAATSGYTFNVNIPAVFNSTVNFVKDIIAPNVLYSLKGGDGVSVDPGQDPTITNTGAISLNGYSGELLLKAGSGIKIKGLSISNSDTGSSQNIFKNVVVDNQPTVQANSNSDTLTFAGGAGLTLTTDAANKTIIFTPDTSAINISGWTHSGNFIYNTIPTDMVGIGTTPVSHNLEIAGTEYVLGAATLGSTLDVVGDTTLLGTLLTNGGITLGNANTDLVTFNAGLAAGTVIAPVNDLGADLGTASLRFNNLYVANLNSNTGMVTQGQAIFSYSPSLTAYTDASVIINPTSPVANGLLLGIGVAGNEKAGIDAEGDLTLGYSGLSSAPVGTNPLTIYNHGTDNVAGVDTSGNLILSGNLDINGTTNTIAALNLSGNNLTSSGALSIAPEAGSNLNASVSNGGQFTVNSSKLTVDGTTGYVGIGTTTASAALDVAAIIGLDGIVLSNSGTKALGISYGTNNIALNLPSADPGSLLTNGTFENDLTGWTGKQTYSLNDEFTDSGPTTLVSGFSTLTNGGVITPSLGGDLVTNGIFDSDTGWTKGANWSIANGVATRVAGTGSSSLSQAGILTIGNWYQTGFSLANHSDAWGFYITYLGFTYNTIDSNTSYVLAGRASSTTVALQSNVAASQGDFDNVYAKPLTLSSLFSTVTESTVNKVVSAGVTLTPGTQAGFVLNLDSASNPQNFVIVYHDGTNLRMDKSVNGVYTSLKTNAAAYVPGATIRVAKNGNNYDMAYNGTDYGVATISDASIVNNSLQGLFSTYAGNSFTNFLITTNLNGTLATDGVNTRSIVDPSAGMSISSGTLNVIANGNPYIGYPTVTRTAGKILTNKLNITSGVLMPLAYASSNGITNGNTLLLSGGNLYVRENNVTGAITGSYGNSTEYQFATVLRSSGTYYFIKGGAFTNWALLWSSTADSGDRNPYIISSSGVFAVDDMRIPISTWLPTPLAYDTFTATGSATTETVGPDGQTAPALSWSGGTKSGGKMSITPTTAESELITNGNMETGTPPSGWTPVNGAVLSSVADERTGGTGTQALDIVKGNSDAVVFQNFTAPTNVWYLVSTYVKSIGSGGGIYIYTNQSSNTLRSLYIGSTSWTNLVQTGRWTGTPSIISLSNSGYSTFRVDDVSVKPLITSSLFSSVTAPTADVVEDVNPTVAIGTQAGLVTNLDSTSNPKNFVIAYLTTSQYDGNHVYLDKSVNGTYTSLINANVTYVPGATLRVITYHSDANTLKVRVYYNNVLVGSEQTITDASIINNTRHGLFSTYSGNTFDNFTLFSRGTDGVYNDIPADDLTVTKDTSITYNGSGASAKLVAGSSNANFTENVNVGNTNSYTLTAYAYTGSSVTSSDLQLYYGSTALTTTYSHVQGDWYKLQATFTGIAGDQPVGVRVKAGKTVYVDNIQLTASTGLATTLFVNNQGVGVTGMDVQGTSSLHAGLSGNTAMVVQGASNQSANLAEWQTSSGSAVASIAANGLLNATTAGLATYVKAGTVSDADFANPVDGMIAIDSLDNRVYFRSAGTWSYAAKTGGFQIPVEESANLSDGDLLIPYVEKSVSDGAIHGLYAKASDITNLLFASESARIAALEKKDNTFGNMSVLGLSTFDSAVVTGTLTLPGISIQGNSIDSDGILKFQSLSENSVQFAGNTLEIDTSGSINIKSGVVAGNNEIRGSVTLHAGTKSVNVERNWIKTPASIIVTPRFNTGAWVTNKSAGGFTINVDTEVNFDQNIDWMAVW